MFGSTGSIGKTLIKIIKKDKKDFEIVLLSADENYKELIKQAKYFKVKNLIITNQESFEKIKKDKYVKKIQIYNNFNNFKKIFKKKINYTMSSITGIQGLKPTIDIIKFSGGEPSSLSCWTHQCVVYGVTVCLQVEERARTAIFVQLE